MSQGPPNSLLCQDCPYKNRDKNINFVDSTLLKLKDQPNTASISTILDKVISLHGIIGN